MKNTTEAEARSILSNPKFCDGCIDWTTLRTQPGTVSCSAGLTDEDGMGLKLLVQLDYRFSPKTRSSKYIFTLFKRNRYGNERVYQLEVLQTQRKIKDQHSRSHEHFGDIRTTGDTCWDDWEYDEVLAHFKKQTNITFDPTPTHPEHFQLKGA